MTDAVAVLKSGGVIVYPTDTAYAIGCDATNEAAVKKVFQIKSREESKTLPLIAADTDMVRIWAEMPEKAEALARKHWPGPFTLVIPVKKQMLKQSLGNTRDMVQHDGFIAVRVPDSKPARDLSKKLGAPLVSTSANKAGEPSCYSLDAVKQSLGDSFNAIDYVVDEGSLPEKKVSTILKVWDNNRIDVIREGAIDIKNENQKQ